MLRNFIVTAWRNLLRNKFYTLLNVAGLAIGLTVGIMILLWVQDELSFDGFHSKAEHIYKINSHLGTGNDEQVWEGAPSPVAVHIKKKLPEVENVVRVAPDYDNSLFTYEDNSFIGSDMIYADPSYFKMFDFRLIKGNRNKPFDDNQSVILSASTAQKIFGDEDPVGKVLQADKKDNFTVTGIIEDAPANSSLRYGMIFPMGLYAQRFRGNGDWKTIDEDLGNFYYFIYVQLRPGTQVATMEKKISDLYRGLRQGDTDTRYTLQPITDLHLIAPDGSASAKQTVNIFLMVAVFILIIACINYVNLSTARSIVRSREVSVRKIIGADRKHLFLQFIFESALLFLVSTLVSFVLIRILLPLYNDVAGKTMVLDFGNRNVWLVLAGAIAGSLLIASIYPAMLLSSFRPVEALKGKIMQGIGNAGFRRTLVVVQFVFSVALIISTVVVGMQLKYLREKDIGYNREHIFTVPIRSEMESHLDAVRNELRSMDAIRGVASANTHIVGMDVTTGDTDWEGKDPNRTFLIHPVGVDENFISLFDMKMAMGNNFSRSKADSANVILNETAVAEAGIVDPIGKQFTVWDTKATIIGVVKDFNYTSLKKRVEPMVFYYQPSNWRLFVKTKGRDAEEAIAAVEKLWMKYSADYPFSYSFVDEDYDKLYKTEQRTSVLFNVFAIVAISISCLGLFGLATYTAHVKKKEVGIRKVLGAGIMNIAGLLARDFVWLVMISLVIAIPVAWWAMHVWLQDFVYRIRLSWWIFAFSGVMALLIAVVTVGFQAVKAALANPVNSLKEE